jgi:hypothetical protein
MGTYAVPMHPEFTRVHISRHFGTASARHGSDIGIVSNIFYLFVLNI